MNLLHFVSLVDTQARLSLKAEASKLYLSYLWWVLEPILFVLVFYLVFEVFLNFGRENYLLFLMCGKIPFLWFSKSVIIASESIFQNRGLINQVQMPKALFPYTSVHMALYKQWVVFLVLFVFVMSYGLLPESNWLWLIPLAAVQYMLILFCSLMGAWLVSFIPDMRMFIAMGITFLLFMSGIFWDVEAIADPGLRNLLFTYNPMAFLIDGYREVLMEQTVYNTQHLMILCFVLAIFLIIAHWLLALTSNMIADKVINA